MADSIRVTLMPDRLTVQPDGDPVESMITIQNTGAIVDQYAVELDQLPTTWYTLSNTAVALFPQDKEEAKLLIHPPKGTAKAGAYPFTATVLSRADPAQTTRVEGIVQVGAVAAFDMAMSPTRVTGRKGRYTLNLRNGGNTDVEVALEAIDTEENCRYGFRHKMVHLGPGAKQQVELTVKARRSSLVGAKKTFDFQVKGSPSKGEVKQVGGQFSHKPLFRTWHPVRRLAALVVLILALVATLAALGGPAGASSRESGWKNRAQSFLCGHLRVGCSSAATPGPAGGAQANTTISRTIPTPVGQAPAGGTPTFVFAFKEFHDHAGTLVGQPLINESTNNGIATQVTTNGMLIYDHASGHSILIRNDQTVWEYFNNVTQQVR
jgi:hypothetical protein